MDYKKIYKNLITRAKSQNRKKKQETYYEDHHIIPDFMFKNRKRNGPKGHLEGNPNDPTNKVLLTAREHIISHMLLYKILKGTHYEYSAGSALIFFKTKLGESIESTHHPRMKEFLGYDKDYERYRLLAKKCISLKNKGWINVKNSLTNEYFGRMSTSDPRYISGEYVHHTKGRKPSKEEIEYYKNNRQGSKNGNYKELTEDIKKRIFSIIDICIVDNHLYAIKFMELLKKELIEYKKLSKVWIINRFGSFEKLAQDYNVERESNIIYNGRFKNSETKKKISEKIKNFKWITNDVENKQISKEAVIPDGYRIGRCNVKTKKNQAR